MKREAYKMITKKTLYVKWSKKREKAERKAIKDKKNLLIAFSL